MTSTLTPGSLDDRQYENDLQLIRRRIIDFATAKVGRDGAEDIAQDCMLLLVEKYSDIRDLNSMIKIAVTIARNKTFEYFRQAKREEEFPETAADQTDIHREVERRQVMDRILPAMLQLGEKCRHLLQLKLFGEKGSAEIQKLLGVNSINTVYTWESRCFKQLMAIVRGTLYAAS